MASEPARHSPALTATVGELDTASAPRAAAVECRAGLTLRQVDEGSTAAAVTQAALPSADTVMAARQSVAQNFMRDMGWSDSRIEGHLKGIDFNQPVDLVELQAGQKLQQWQLPDRPTGHYFTDLGTPPEMLGINPAGRVANVHVAPRDVVLRSTAAPIVDTWTVPGQAFAAKGGGVQYFTARPGDYGRVGNAASTQPGAGFVRFSGDFDAHILNRDFGVPAKRGIGGAHNLDEFMRYSNEFKIVGTVDHPTVNGIQTISYQVAARDPAGRFTGAFRDKVFEKRVFDPSVMSPDTFLTWGRQAAAEGQALSPLNRTWTGTAPNGLKFMGYLDDTGAVRSFFPDF